ncbi:MAG TPA: DUF3426 domain-containing protein [Gammaproteobacteria bacterium]|jgi:predicted Zn finger-like uncharacterized protein
MYTTCTHCHTRFRLTAPQLKAAGGQVRCGECNEVFDAYEALEGTDLPPEMPAPPRLSADDAVEMSDDSIRIREETTPDLEMPMAVEDEPITSAPNLKAGSRKGPPPPIDDLFSGIADEAEPKTAPMAEPMEAAVEPAAISTDPVAMYADEVGSPASFAHVEDLRAPPPPLKPRHPLLGAAGWLLGVVLVLALGAQLIDMDRAALSQNPVIGPSLQALYAALGRPLTKPSAVSEWDVGALNVTTDPDSPGALSITGSLTNGAGFVQPWPYLRVVLTDRFGAALRSRDFKPADYLAPGQAGSVLAPGLAARFRLDIVDPGADAVGFSLTPCLDMTSGRVCAAPSATD